MKNFYAYYEKSSGRLLSISPEIVDGEYLKKLEDTNVGVAEIGENAPDFKAVKWDDAQKKLVPIVAVDTPPEARRKTLAAKPAAEWCNADIANALSLILGNVKL